MKKPSWRNSLSVDFSQDTALKEALLAELMCRTDPPIDFKEEVPMKTAVKLSTRTVIVVLIIIAMLSGIALATMKSLSLGPFAIYSHEAYVDERKWLEDYVNTNRSIWEGKLFYADGTPIEDLAEYLWTYAKSEHPYELYNADGKLAMLSDEDDKAVLITAETEFGEGYEDRWMYFGTFKEARPYLNSALIPALPTILPDGYALEHYRIMTDGDGVPYPDAKYLYVTYKKNNQTFEIHIRLMDEETSFEMTTPATLSELTINGHSAVFVGRVLSILVGDMLYEYYPDGSGLTMDELIKMAESM